MQSEETRKLKGKAKASLTLLLVAVISISTATYAWFSLSGSASVQSMEIQVGTGAKLEVATSENGTYGSVLTNDDINAAMQLLGGWDFAYTNGLSDIRLWPLTSGNGAKLYTKSNNENTPHTPDTGKSGHYLEMPLWFRSTTAMDVYLNQDDFSTLEQNGTRVTSSKTKENEDGTDGNTHKAMRLSVTSAEPLPGTVLIYEPEKNLATTLQGQALTDNPVTPKATQPTFNVLGTNGGLQNSTDTTPVLFSLVKDEPQLVTLRIWIEGEDPQCNNNATTTIEKEYLNVRLRFCGADKDGGFIEAS